MPTHARFDDLDFGRPCDERIECGPVKREASELFVFVCVCVCVCVPATVSVNVCASVSIPVCIMF